jgi:anthranilate phosphoribosyltransferase
MKPFDLLEALLDARRLTAQISGALVALAAKGETVDELTGMAEGPAFAGGARDFEARTVLSDTAGTGSSRAKTFNISTARRL